MAIGWLLHQCHGGMFWGQGELFKADGEVIVHDDRRQHYRLVARTDKTLPQSKFMDTPTTAPHINMDAVLAEHLQALGYRKQSLLTSVSISAASLAVSPRMPATYSDYLCRYMSFLQVKAAKDMRDASRLKLHTEVEELYRLVEEVSASKVDFCIHSGLGYRLPASY